MRRSLWQRSIFLCFFILSQISGLPAAGPAAKTTSYNDLLLEGFRSSENFDLHHAHAVFDQATAMKPDDPEVYLLRAESYWWMFVNRRENKDYEKRLKDNIDQAIKLAEAQLKKDKGNTEALLALAGGYGRWGMLEGLYNSRWEAVKKSMKARSILQKAVKMKPDLYDAYAWLGMYDYFAARMPGYARFASKVFFGLYGNKEQGLRDLRTAIEKGTYTKNSAKFFLALFLLRYEKNFPEGVKLAKELSDAYPENLNYLSLLAFGYNETKEYDKSAHLYQTILEKAQARDLYGKESLSVTRCFLGNALRQAYKLDEAERVLHTVINENPDDRTFWFVAYAHLHLGRIYDVKGERETAKAEYQRVLQLKDFDGSHKKASAHLKTPYRDGS
jgi:tetratricopeptide (TPR) repeat protein